MKYSNMANCTANMITPPRVLSIVTNNAIGISLRP